MATTTTISQKELERQAALCLEGETLVVMLCSVGSTGYTANTLLSSWETVEVSGDADYARVSEVIGTGAWNGTAGAYVIPSIDAQFSAAVGGSGYSYDRVVLFIDGATYPHSIISESPNIVLAPGQSQTYRLTLQQDD